MKKRTRNISISIFALLFIFTHSVKAQGSEKIHDILHVNHADLHIDGYIAERFNSVYEKSILDQDVDHLIAPFYQRTESNKWQSEFWGKWITSAILAYKYRPEPRLKTILDDAVSDLIATQSPDGYIGNYAPEYRLQQWDIWGRKYCLLGLLDYFELTGGKESLKAARKLADHLIYEIDSAGGLIIDKGNYRGMAASSILEPICLLYNATKEPKYLDFAQEIVRQWELPNGPKLLSKSSIDVSRRFSKPANWFGWDQGQKAYEMMSCYEGLLELYRITGNEIYKETVERVWQNIYENEINIVGSGSAGEMWFGGSKFQTYPIFKYQETCVTVTWVKLTHRLLRLTGEAKYADAVERTFYNALLGAVSPDGKEWAKYTPLIGQRLPGSGQCGMDLNCCEASGPRGLFNIPGHVVMNTADGVAINYYIQGTYNLTTPSGKTAELAQETKYPAEDLITIHVDLKSNEEFAIDIRIPSWSEEHKVLVNGEQYYGDVGDYLSISREWRKGDKIEIQLDLRGKVSYRGDIMQYVAITRGPIVLTMDQRLVGPNISKTIKPIVGKNNLVELHPIAIASDKVWMAFEATFLPESYVEGATQPINVLLCDYASAGYGENHPMYRVWLPQLIDPRDF